MAQAILRPSATGTYDFWTLGAGASKAAATDPGDPISHDADTTYINIGTSPGANNQQSLYLNTGLPTLIASVNSIDYSTRGRTTGTPGVESRLHFIRRGTTDGSTDTTVMTGSYADLTTSSIARPGGGSWVPGDFVTNNIQGAVSVDAGLAQPCRVTSIWAVLDYYPPAGAFTFLIFEWLGPVIGAALTMRDAFRIVQAANEATRGMHRILEAEIPQVFADLTASRRRYCFF